MSRPFRGAALAAGLLVTCVAWGEVAAPDLSDVQILRVNAAGAAELVTLRALERELGADLEVWPETLRDGGVQVRVTSAGRSAVERAGLFYEIVIANLQQHEDAQAAAGADLDFFSAIRTYDEHTAFLQALADTYPNLAQMIDIGKSVENRSMWGLRITGAGKVKPAIFYHGAQHGNEKAPASMIAYVAHNLLTRYAAEPEIRALVDHAEWYLVPISNPDGYVRNQRRNVHNVDLNRNWDCPGAGQDPTGGPYPFSEPETQHLRDVILAHANTRMHLYLHGYIALLMWPWGYTATLPPDHATFQSFTTVCRDKISQAGGGNYGIGPIYTTIYPAYGSSADYSYDLDRIWALAWEAADSQMPNICNEFLPALLYLGSWMWSYDCNANKLRDANEIALGLASDFNHNQVPDECDALGDVNCDDLVDFFDINPFVLALTDPAGYGQQFPDCPLLKRDINGDGQVSFLDLNPFVALLTRGN